MAATVETHVLRHVSLAQWKEIGVDGHVAVERVGANGWYVLGEETRDFARRLAEARSVPCAVGVGNGMDAREIALRCLGPRPRGVAL